MDTYKTTFSGYQRLLNDPFSEPVSGVPNEFGMRTRKIRVRVREMVVADANDVKFKCMPHAGVANDVDIVRIEGGHVLGTANSYLRTSSDYQNSDLSDSLRSRLVSARLRVTPTHATSNGTLYACSDPGREDIGGLTNEQIESRFSKGNMAVGRASEESMQILYRPTLDEEVEGWVTDATKAPYEFARDITATEYPCSHMITWSGNNAAGDQLVTGSGVTVEAYAPGSAFENLYQPGTSINVYHDINPGGGTQVDIFKKDEMLAKGEQGYTQFSGVTTAEMKAAGWKIMHGRGYNGLVAWKHMEFPWNLSTFNSNYISGYANGDHHHLFMFTCNDAPEWPDWAPISGTNWPYLEINSGAHNPYNPKATLFEAPLQDTITIDYGTRVPYTGLYPTAAAWYYRASSESASWQYIGAGQIVGTQFRCPSMWHLPPLKALVCVLSGFTSMGIGNYNVGFSAFQMRPICAPGARYFYNASTGPWGLGQPPNQTHIFSDPVTTQGALATGVNQGEPIMAFNAEAQTEAKPQTFWVEFDAVYELSGDEVITDATPNPSRGGERIVAYYDACSAVRKVGAGKREFDELDRGDKMS